MTNIDSSIEYGKWLTSCPPDEGVVVSGIAGLYPKSKNFAEFQQNLMEKRDMVSDEDCRWDYVHPEIPNRCGVIPNINKFDAGYFGFHYRQTHSTDPLIRTTLERAIEALMDAGVHPKELEGTKTGVFVGSCSSESEINASFNLMQNVWSVAGVLRSFNANRISYFLKLKGPSYNVDTACSSSGFALEHAFKEIRNGNCDSAIVCGSNLCLHPFCNLQFARLGVLSVGGQCRVFDEDASGYARSEGIIVVYLQKYKDARRVHCHLMHSKTNCDGFKQQGITFPSSQMQIQLLNEIYLESNLNIEDFSFLEAHGTGTTIGDPEELAGIYEVFKERKYPLQIGSVKSNIGHNEPASGLSSLSKAIIAINTGIIPPNINFNRPKENSEALQSGKFHVVANQEPLEDKGLIAINNFGFGGANVHTVVKKVDKEKVNKGFPEDDLPRLVCISGRSEEAVQTILDDINGRELDAEYIWLYHQIFKTNSDSHLYRGYCITNKSGEIKRSIRFSPRKTQLRIHFGDMNASWKSVMSSLEDLELFKNTITNARIMMKKLINSDKSIDSTTLDKIHSSIIQLALVEVLKRINLVPYKISGSGYGVFAYFYWKRSVDFEKILKCIHFMTTQKSPKSEKLLEGFSKILDDPKSSNHKLSKQITKLIVRNSKNLEKCSEDTVILSLDDNSYKTTNQEEINLTLTNQNGTNSLVYFLEILGDIYQLGYCMKIDQLYPKIEQPVSRGTPLISSLIKWRHQSDWFVVKFNISAHTMKQESKFVINTSYDEWKYLQGHVIDGRTLFPAAAYLYIVWETLGLCQGLKVEEFNLLFENCKFVRPINLEKGTMNEILVLINKKSGYFEVTYRDMLCALGIIKKIEDEEMEYCGPERCPSNEKGISLNTRDVYKELHLRGYNYKGEFKRIKLYNPHKRNGLINWNDNWVTFIDNMLQMKILEFDSRLLYVPTGIRHLAINARVHVKKIKELNEENPDLPIYISKESDTLSCEGIVIRGITANSIARRKNLTDPVLEKYIFIPNKLQTSLEESIRVIMQISLENLPNIKVKVVELIDEATVEDSEPLSIQIYIALSDLPLIQPDILILSKKEIDVPNATVEDKQIITENECAIIVGTNLMERSIPLQQSLNALKTNGFIISREKLDFVVPTGNSNNISVLVEHYTDTEKLIFFRKPIAFDDPLVLDVTDFEEFSWLNKAQDAIKKKKNLILYAENQVLSGILGLTNCMRRELGPDSIKCFFMMDSSAPKFDINDQFYKKQLAKTFALNVYANGKWGTYRHLKLENPDAVESEHCFVNTLTKGDLSSLTWLEGPYTSETNLDFGQELIHVYYAPLNFRDIMTASGRINADVVTLDRIKQQMVQGFEFCGRTKNGKRVMGISNGSLSSIISADSLTSWEIPSNWSMEDASTVPCVYATALYAFCVRAKIYKGCSVLIHCGAGGVGLAAINLALYTGCVVYTTVGTEEKREYLKKTYPQLKDENIGYSRDTCFEQMIFERTNGKGVDFVLNSLSEEKMKASIRCLARGGTFLEIGKFDLASNHEMHLLLLEKEASFHGIMLDQFFEKGSFIRNELDKLIVDGIMQGILKPLPRTIFEEDEIEQAFRFMMSGKHIGKVIVKLRDEEQQQNLVPQKRMLKGTANYYCYSDKVYIIIGGLGGFGLELVDWLMLNGARKLVLTSRTGVQTGYQYLRIKSWESYGVQIEIKTHDITTEEGCRKLLEEANELGEVQAIFNLAVVLRDAIFENQSLETFKTSFGPKAYATMHLDKVSRELCPNLKDFVVFSSVSCGRGNSGQTNYGMGNSIMERICEKRRLEGLPGLAIQWGAIADVGLVAEMQEDRIEMEIGGTLQQKISNCLHVLSSLLRQEHAIVSSMVVAEKRTYNTDNAVEMIANALGIKDVKTVSPHQTLAELGMDSMIAVEVKQILERDFQVFLTAQDIRNLTFAKLVEMQEKGMKEFKVRKVTLDQMVGRIVDEEFSSVLYTLSTRSGDRTDVKHTFWIPGIEGIAKTIENLASKLRVSGTCLQFCSEPNVETIEALAKHIADVISKSIFDSKCFNLISYSYGVIVALDVVSILEKKGYSGCLICIDGSLDYFKDYTKTQKDGRSEEHFQTDLCCQFLSLYMPFQQILQHRTKLMGCKSLQERLDIIEILIPKGTKQSPKYVRRVIQLMYNRIIYMLSYEPTFKLKTPIRLFKPTNLLIADYPDDYNLSKFCENIIEMKAYEGDHISILDNEDMANDLNTIFANEAMNQ